MPMVRRRWGRIVNISSLAGLVGNRGQVNYSAAKAGLIGATRSLAKEVAKRNVTVNAVAPGLIDTDMIKQIPVDDLTKLIPMRRLGLPVRGREAGPLPGQRRRRLHHRAGDHDRRRAGVSASSSASRSGRRVVVTGIGLASPIGNDLRTATAALREGRHGIVTMPEWAEVQGLSTRLAGARQGRPVRRLPAQEDAQHGARRAARHLRDRAGVEGRGPRPGSDVDARRRARLRLDPRLVIGAGGVLPHAVRAQRPARDPVDQLPQVHEQHLRHQPGLFLRHPGARDLHLLRLHERQPRDRLRLRGDPRRAARRHDLRRRRGDALHARGGVRHPVRDVAALQRPPGRRLAPVRRRPRRSGGRRGRGHVRARGGASGRGGAVPTSTAR